MEAFKKVRLRWEKKKNLLLKPGRDYAIVLGMRIECIFFVVLSACKNVDRARFIQNVLRSTLLHAYNSYNYI